MQYLTIFKLGNPFAHPGKTLHTPYVIYVGNVNFDWFNQYLFTGEHFQSDLDIFQFNFMFVKPHDVPPLLCFNMQTVKWDFAYNSSFLQCLPSGNRSCCNQNLISVCMLKQSSRGTSCGFTNIKLYWNISRSDWKCSPVHAFPRVGEWVSQRDIRPFRLYSNFTVINEVMFDLDHTPYRKYKDYIYGRC